MLINWVKFIIYYYYDLKIMMYIAPEMSSRPIFIELLFLIQKNKNIYLFDVLIYKEKKVILVSKKDIDIALNEIKKIQLLRNMFLVYT